MSAIILLFYNAGYFVLIVGHDFVILQVKYFSLWLVFF